MGILIPDAQADSATVLLHVVGAPCIVTVGDRTTEKLIEFGIVPDLQIVDGREERHSRRAPVLPLGTVEIQCANPPAEITDESIEKILRAFSSATPVRITVRGEEDLLVIPACIHAPKDAVVLYGQPGEGVVIVHVDAEIRHKTQTLLDSIRHGGNDETVAV